MKYVRKLVNRIQNDVLINKHYFSVQKNRVSGVPGVLKYLSAQVSFECLSSERPNELVNIDSVNIWVNTIHIRTMLKLLLDSNYTLKPLQKTRN